MDGGERMKVIVLKSEGYYLFTTERGVKRALAEGNLEVGDLIVYPKKVMKVKAVRKFELEREKKLE